MTRQLRYVTTADGEQVSELDVEIPERVPPIERARPGIPVPKMPLLPALDEDGIDREGFAWGARR